MPCWEVRTTNVEFGSKTSTNILADAVREMGGTVHGETETIVRFSLNGSSCLFSNGELTIEGGGLTASALKDAYASTVIKKFAEKKRWKVQKSTKTQGRYHLKK